VRRTAPASRSDLALIGPDIIDYLDTGKVYATGPADEPGPTVDRWEGED
jgi:hypothetical protein